MTDKLDNYYENYNYGARMPVYMKEEEMRPDQWDRLIKTDNFCMIPWIHMHAFPDGRAYPCCLGDPDHSVGNLKTHTMKEIWNQDPLKQMRLNMMQDRPCKECTKCVEQERSELFSMRNSSNKNFGHLINLVDETNPDGSLNDFKLRYYDVRFSNICNFSCRSCGSLFSSSWYRDEKAAGWNPQHPQIMFAGKNKDDMWDQMQEHIPHLEQIYWAGGEPLIMEEHYRVLRELVDREMFHVRLIYNTNFSEMKFKGQDVMELWKLFDCVSVGASLDASYHRGEYMRKGQDWRQTVENRERMLKVCPNVDFYVSSTVSLMNVIHIPDFHREWVDLGLLRPMDWNINMLQHPLRYRVDALPPNLKRRARDRIEEHLEWLEPLDTLTRATSGYKGVLNFMEHNDSTAYLPDFFKVNELIDKVREENFFETFPELVEMKNYKLPQTMCMLPWVSIETSPVGSARPCCLATDEIVDENGNKYDMNQHTVTEIYNSKYMQDLRKSFREGNKPATCTRCWEEEDAGRTSKRLHTLTRFKERYAEVDWENDKPNQLWFLDLKLGNICNLKCRICGSWSSSKWVPEEMEYVKDWGGDPKKHIAYTWLKQGNWPRNQNSPRFWEDLKTILPHVKYFEFTGGEPFMIQEHFDLLKFAADNGYADNIEIHYNTNGTHFPEEFIDTWRQFRKVEIAFSIDNVGERFEYERSGAQWTEVEANIQRFHAMKADWPRLRTQVCMTINVQNVLYLEDLCKWVILQNFDYDYFNMMHDPKHMNIGSMTEAAKALVIKRLTAGDFIPRHRKEIDRIIQFIKNGETRDNAQFLKEMQRTDRYRGEDFAETHTDIARAMGYDKT